MLVQSQPRGKIMLQPLLLSDLLDVTPVLQEASSTGFNAALGSLAAAVSAAALLASPLDAMAVVGGGGPANPISFEDWSNKDLTKIKFTKAMMKETNFTNSNLSGVSMFGAFAEGANFTGANLANADIESGKFAKADFTNAVLSGAFANNAQLEGIKIDNSDWTDVDLRKYQRAALCEVAKGTNPVTGVDTRESLMCP